MTFIQVVLTLVSLTYNKHLPILEFGKVEFLRMDTEWRMAYFAIWKTFNSGKLLSLDCYNT